ncbi:MAG TPA: PqqD family protein [Thermoanaerobaculia bacterium]|jgi:hypothetical protein|nr:PqqD family protein [Thermoanaerobaculia bacterium]
MTETLFKRKIDVETAPLQNDSIVFHPGQNRFCILNRTSSFIWQRLESPATPAMIATELSSSFAGITPADALQDVQQALSTLLSLDLVVETSM